MHFGKKAAKNRLKKELDSIRFTLVRHRWIASDRLERKAYGVKHIVYKRGWARLSIGHHHLEARSAAGATESGADPR